MHLAQELLMSIEYSGGSRSFAKEMGALKLKETVASHPKMTPTNWEDHQSLSSYNYTRSCWWTHCRPFCGHLAFEANWKDKKAQSVGASWADCKSKKSLSWNVIFSYTMQQQKTISWSDCDLWEHMEIVRWKHTLPYIKYIASGNLLYDSRNSNQD